MPTSMMTIFASLLRCLRRVPRGLAALVVIVAPGVEAARAAPAAHCAGTVYVANTPDGTVSVIDTSTDSVIATIPVGKLPAMPVFTRDGTRAYVNNSGDGTISEINVVDHSVARTIRLPDGLSGSGFAVSPNGRRAILTKLGDPGFAVIVDLVSGRASQAIPVGNGSERVAITPDNRRAYVADGNPRGDNGTVTIIDLDSAKAIRTIPVGKFPFNLVVMPNGKMVYVANIFGGSISEIETRSNMVIGTIKTAPFPNGLALARNGKSIYITNFSGGTLQVLDLKTHTVSAPVRTSANPSYMALSADGEQAYYVHPMGNTVSVVDTKTFGLASTIVVGKNPTALGACPFPGKARIVAPAKSPESAAAASTAASAPRRFSVDETPLGDLLDNAGARAVLARHLPWIVDSPQIATMRGMTLTVLRIMSSGRIDESATRAIDAELAQLQTR